MKEGLINHVLIYIMWMSLVSARHLSGGEIAPG